MNFTFMSLGLIDLVAGAILFFEPSVIVKVISVVLMTKGILTFVKAL
jgi:hypothetical protein